MANLLVVEDDPALLTAMQELLAIQGHQVRGAASGLTALDAMATDRPELVISDMTMPGMTGLQLLHAVRARPEWDGIPFVFVSASSSQQLGQQIATWDGVSYLPKPFEIEALIETVMTALGVRSGLAAQRVGA